MTRKLALTVALVAAWLATLAGIVALWMVIPLGVVAWMAGMGLVSYAAFDGLKTIWGLDDDLDGETV